MKVEDYYRYQTQARGLLSGADADREAIQIAPVYQRMLSHWLPGNRNAVIHEVACGPGIMLRFLRDRGYTNISGSDSAECQITLAKAAGLSVALTDSLAELKATPAAHWDCLLAIDFIEHLPKDVLLDFLAHCFRVLKPGGLLIMRAPNADSPLIGFHLFNDITHHWAYTSNAMRALLKMAGFSHVIFNDESLAGIEKQRWLKVPLMRLAQWGVRFAIRAATRERVQYLSPSIFTAAWKE